MADINLTNLADFLNKIKPTTINKLLVREHNFFGNGYRISCAKRSKKGQTICFFTVYLHVATLH